MGEIKVDPEFETGFTIPVYFFNGGRTPAHHFIAIIRTHVRHAHDADNPYVVMDEIKKTGRHITRYEYLDNGERSDSGGIDIAANSPHIEYAQIMTPNMTHEDLTGVLPPGERMLGVISLLGTFEYCDEFGAYHCTELDLVYNRSKKRFESGPHMEFDCNLGPVTSVPYMYGRERKYAVRILRRCEQLNEQEQSQREADKSAGKIIFLAPPTPATP
jgi:hypothetical protein